MVEANPISKAKALQEAKEFLSSKGIVMQTTDEAYKAPRKANSKDANPYYYIYNVYYIYNKTSIAIPKW